MEATIRPDPRLRSLDPLVGEWELYHRDLETGETWGGRDRFAWMDGGFFLAFEHEEFGRGIAGTMIIGFERRWGAEDFSGQIVGHWFESSTGNHFVYFWDMAARTVRFALEEPESVFRFEGTLNDAQTKIEGRWHVPEGGNDYALTMTRTNAGA